MSGIVATVIGVGFVLGLRHALDPDHVVAVTTLASQRAGFRRTSLVGAWWGLGHALTLSIAGGAILLLRVTVPPRVSDALEAVVAVMLIVLGALALRRAARWRLHAHPHEHDGATHVHFHAHAAREAAAVRAAHDPPPHDTAPHRAAAHHHPHPFSGGLRPFLVGCVHGLAGSAGLALLVLSAAPTLAAGALYLVVFALGTIGGMLLLSALMSLPLGYLESRYAAVHRAVQIAAGAASLGFGLLLLGQYAAAVIARG
jgi:ABC-type nickel/cobalt efflux system permease component RcnA